MDRRRRLLAISIASAFWVGSLSGCSRPTTTSEGATPAADSVRAVLFAYEDLANTRFTPVPEDPRKPPTLIQVTIPPLEGAYAIWGATGRDHRGHIWIGVSAFGSNPPSAHLVEYLPEQDQIVNHGDVVTELKRAGVYRDGEEQMKIHSKVIEAADGNLYFTSSDESGENEDGSKLPTWGSHLWRLRPPDYHWEHLMAAPEGLIAVSGFGMRVYALGYFDHVLYQFDCQTGKIRSVRVGSAGGHVTRNFLSDERGHVYVPRLKYQGVELVTTLVEFDATLKEIGESTIGHYIQQSPLNSHGIIGVQYLADHSIVFVTHMGYLYRVTPHTDSAADVTEVGWFHPAGEAYVASLFSLDGGRYLMGASNRENRYEWLVYDLATRSSARAPLDFPHKENQPWQGLLLYGSLTRDNLGNFYLGGTYTIERNRSAPVLFQARPGR